MASGSRLYRLLIKLPEAKEALVYHHVQRESSPIYGEVDLDTDIVEVLKRQGINRLYKHQADALKALESGKNVIVSTGTASGKTLIYLIQVIRSCLKDKDSRALYVTPLKALAQDQLRQLSAFLMPFNLSLAIYDGDTPKEQRRIIRSRPPHLLLTNPDMLHKAILPYHSSWKEFLSNLKYVVLDEVHTYRGIFGSHVHQVIKRLKRICRHYEAHLRFIMLSATVGNPAEFGQRLIDEEVEEVSKSTSERAFQDFVFFNPKEGANLFAAKLFCHLIKNKVRTIVFTQSRLATELLYLWATAMLGHLRHKVRPYRAGFLPSQRRQIERELASGDLLGVISTSALELGIDIGSLEACILVGYPGTMMTTWQRSGRVGRGNQESITVLIGKEDALDQYFMKNPKEFFERDVEDAVLDRYNPYIVKDHLLCAAHEFPLGPEDEIYWPRDFKALVEELETRGLLTRGHNHDHWFSAKKNPSRDVDIRSTGESFHIFDLDTGEAIGSIDGIRAFRECHEGAIYLHMGQRYQIKAMDLQKKDILASTTKLDYFTRIRSEKETEILEAISTRQFNTFHVGLGRLKVTELITGYEKRSFPGQILLGVTPLELPPIVFDTVGIWLKLNPGIKVAAEKRGFHFMGGIHAIEHAMIGMFPLFVLCDRNDIGGISHTYHPNLDAPGIFLYDGYPGGVGLSEKAFGIIESLLEKTLAQISTCPCETGCPSCIHSPKCGSGNRPLDKACATFVLEILLGKREIEELVGIPKEIKAKKRPSKVLFFDLETQYSSDEVGGWTNVHLMKMSIGCIYDLSQDSYSFFKEEEVDSMIEELFKGELVVGFNIKEFDYKVLSYYSRKPFFKIPTLDLLQHIHSKLGRRISLSALAKGTLNRDKVGNGLDAIRWYREKNFEKLAEYCKLDVELTKEIYLYGISNRYVKYFDHTTNRKMVVPVDW